MGLSFNDVISSVKSSTSRGEVENSVVISQINKVLDTIRDEDPDLVSIFEAHVYLGCTLEQIKEAYNISSVGSVKRRLDKVRSKIKDLLNETDVSIFYS